jgi:hypothetical protein
MHYYHQWPLIPHLAQAFDWLINPNSIGPDKNIVAVLELVLPTVLL